MKRFRLAAILLALPLLAACSAVSTDSESSNALGDWVSGLLTKPALRFDEAYNLVESAPCADPKTQFKAGQIRERGTDGVEADPVAAYAWYAIAAARGYEPAAASRDTLAAQLSTYQLSEAGRIASTWPPSSCEN
jgi:TPR repeat protein